MIDAASALPVHHVLVQSLELLGGVPEDLAILLLLGDFGLGKALVKHVLVIFDEGGVTAELVVELVLRVRQHVLLVAESCHVRLAPVHWRRLVVLSQI